MRTIHNTNRYRAGDVATQILAAIVVVGLLAAVLGFGGFFEPKAAVASDKNATPTSGHSRLVPSGTDGVATVMERSAQTPAWFPVTAYVCRFSTGVEVTALPVPGYAPNTGDKVVIESVHWVTGPTTAYTPVMSKHELGSR
jgi:hypothetical protein